MKNYSNLKAIDIMAILRDYNNIVEMDLTLDELRDVAEFIATLCNTATVKRMHEAFTNSANNYNNLCGWNERAPLEITEQDCEDAFCCVKWRVQELAEEVCDKPWKFLAQ